MKQKFLSLNINKAKKELKWKPKLTLSQTVEFTIDWYMCFLRLKIWKTLASEQIEMYMDYQ